MTPTTAGTTRPAMTHREVLEALSGRVDKMLIGGAMANTFLRAQGHKTGKSKVEEDKLPLARSFLKKVDERGVPVLLPRDVVAEAPEGALVRDTAPLHLDEIVGLMAEADGRGEDVARVHSGDPSLYGAVAEQARRLDALGIPWAITPGVPAFAAAAATLGLELTLPGVCQSVVLTRTAVRASSGTWRGLAAGVCGGRAGIGAVGIASGGGGTVSGRLSAVGRSPEGTRRSVRAPSASVGAAPEPSLRAARR